MDEPHAVIVDNLLTHVPYKGGVEQRDVQAGVEHGIHHPGHFNLRADMLYVRKKKGPSEEGPERNAAPIYP